MKRDPFNYSGMASLRDLESNKWKTLYEEMEKVQEEFLKYEYYFRSPKYQWPRDPLHTWSRVWEYPYVLHHLRHCKSVLGTKSNCKVLDFGSGVTFFPFLLSREGFDVITMDINPSYAQDILRAAEKIDHKPGSIVFIANDGKKVPLEDSSVDAIYCISVIEHMTEFQNIINEFARVLKPQGILILTIDIAINGFGELSNEGYENLRTLLEENFIFHAIERVHHSANYLLSSIGPFPLYFRANILSKLKGYIKNILTTIINKVPCKPVIFGCHGFVLKSRKVSF